MKKLLLFSIALCVSLLFSCMRSEEIGVEKNSDQIGFSIYTAKTTRATEATTTSLQNSTAGFGVFAYYTLTNDWASTNKPDYMYNQQVTYPATTAWHYNPLKYWPNTLNHQLTFFAYAPWEEPSTTYTDANPAVGVNMVPATTEMTGAPKITVRVDPDPANHVDFLYANSADIRNLKKQTTPVMFNFAHAMTRVNFQAKLNKDLAAVAGTDGTTYVFIKDMSIVKESAALWEAAQFEFENGTWNYTSDNVKARKISDDFSIDFTNIRAFTTPLGVANYTPEMAAAGATSAALRIDSTTPKAMFKTTADETPLQHYAFLIPPSATGVTSQNDVMIDVAYDIVTLDDAVKDGYSIASTVERVSLPVGSLVMGKAYMFTLTIGLENIEVTEEVTDWVDNDPAELAAPSVEVNDGTNGTFATFAEGLAALNAIKKVDTDCNYFVIYLNNTEVTDDDVSNALETAALISNFVVGDIIEIVSSEAMSLTDNLLWQCSSNGEFGTRATASTKHYFRLDRKPSDITSNTFTVSGSNVSSNTIASTYQGGEILINVKSLVTVNGLDTKAGWSVMALDADNNPIALPDWIAIDGAATREVGNDGTLQNTYSIKAQTPTIATPPFADAVAKGSAESPQSLVTDGKTANCYVVSAPGTYSFPCNVMGNGNGGIVSGAGFVDYSGNQLTSATIDPTGCTAELLWQTQDGAITSVTLNGNIIVFTTATAETLKQGNAVIALKNSAGKIVWSWHIWITNDVDDNITMTGSSNVNYNIMNQNLGYFNNGPATYAARTATIRLTQNGSGNTIDLTINQEGKEAVDYGGVHYQYGRKDPFPHGTNDVEVTLYGNGYTSVQLPDNSGTQSHYYYETIQNPQAFYRRTYYYGSTNNDYKLWGATQSGGSSDVKTIYDPCPVGYMVPKYNVFSESQNAGKDSTLPIFYLYDSSKVKQPFPIAGHRNDVGQNEVKDVNIEARLMTSRNGLKYWYFNGSYLEEYYTGTNTGESVRPMVEPVTP